MSRESAAWQPVATVRRTPGVTLQWLVGSTVAFFAFAYLFVLVLAARRGRSIEPIVVSVPAPGTLRAALAVSGVALIVVIALHEWLHGLFLGRYGGDPSYGVATSFGLPYAFATADGDEDGYARNEMVVMLLAPFAIITLAGTVALLVVPSPLLAFVLAANAAGSVADLWMAATVLRYPAAVRVGEPPDSAGGFGIYARSDEARRPASGHLTAFVAGAVATFALLAIVFGTLVLHSLAFGSGTVRVGGAWSLFEHRVDDRGVVRLSVDEPGVVGLSALGGLCWALLSGVRRR